MPVMVQHLLPRPWGLSLLGACLLAPLPALPQDAPIRLQVARQVETKRVRLPGLADQVRAGLNRAVREHPEVLAALAAAQTRGLETEAAENARYPRFQVGSGVGSTDAQSGAGGKQSYRVLSLNARMTLIDGGVIGSRIEAAQANSEASEAAVRSVAQKVALDALTAYLQVLRHENKRAVAERAIAALDELVRLEQRRADLGATGESELRLARSRRAAFAAKQQESQSQLAEALARFETYFGFVPDPARLPAPVVPGHWLPPTQAETLRIAEALSTELAEARSKVENARAQVRQQEAARFPSLDVVVARTRDPRGVVYSDATRSGVELNWNFGNGFDLQLRVKTALAEVANQEAKLESARLNLVQLTTTAWGQARANRDKAGSLAEALQESTQLLDGRRRLLSFGRETLVGVLDAQVEHELQVIDGVDAVADQRINELRVARVTGRLLPDAQTGAANWVDQLFGPIAQAGLLPAVMQAGSSAPASAPSATGGRGGNTVAAVVEPGIRLQAAWSLRPQGTRW